jgi:hypothetical protein
MGGIDICKTCFSLGGLPETVETAETAEDFESLWEVSERSHSHSQVSNSMLQQDVAIRLARFYCQSICF